MASYEQRPEGTGPWRAQICRKGYPRLSATFDTKAEAEAWAVQTEAKMLSGRYVDLREATKVTLGDGLEKYLAEFTPGKRGAKQEEVRIKAWLEEPLTKKALSDVTSADLSAYRDKRLKIDKVSASTVRSELSIISVVYKAYDKDWGMPGIVNPMKSVRLPKPAKGRDRRIEGDELERLCEAAGKKHPELPLIFMLAADTAMRRSELVTITADQVKGCVVKLEFTKNGDDRDVPLSTTAVEILNRITPREDGRLFSLSPQTVSNYMAEVRREAGIKDLRLHDLRHEATSRLFEKGLHIMEAAAVTGHKTLDQLKKYTHLRAENIAKKLG
ncbi:MAG: site-specific integrase [Aquipseudomonas alcaligenes]|uniref:Site-specific integrase n=1 Tax=Aquipseudomonas alcaligenes TaxID=43263 RepID=A0A5C7W9Y9_AQUAC|nr:MAG: site-specific integrase [Pseudomonas alcaligenes]